MNIAKKSEQKKTTLSKQKTLARNDDHENLGLLQELSTLNNSKKKGIIRIEVDSRRR